MGFFFFNSLFQLKEQVKIEKETKFKKIKDQIHNQHIFFFK